MSKGCFTIVTSLAFVGSIPALRIAAYSSGSFPKPHVPTFLLFQSSGFVMFFSLNATSRVPERWKYCAMSTRSAPASRDASIFGTHAMPNSGPSAATTCCGAVAGVHESGPSLPRCEHLRHPRDAEFGAVGRDDLLRDDVGAAELDLHVKP